MTRRELREEVARAIRFLEAARRTTKPDVAFAQLETADALLAGIRKDWAESHSFPPPQ